MFHRRTIVLSWLLIAVLLTLPCARAADWSQLAPLASHVPAETRLFVEIRDLDALASVPAGARFGKLVLRFVNAFRPAEPTTAPAGSDRHASAQAARSDDPIEMRRAVDWPRLLADAMGIERVRTTRLLLDGPVAVALESWTDLGAAVLLARPREPEALEWELRARRVEGTVGDDVRRYELGQNHELSTDGTVVILGHRSGPGGLYPQIRRLLGSERGVSLADLAEFRQRLAELPDDVQMVGYLGTNRRRPTRLSASSSFLPVVASPVRSAAFGVRLTDEGVVAESSIRLSYVHEPVQAHNPPVEALLFLPASTIAAWTYPLDYVDGYEQLQRQSPRSLVRFYLNLIQWGMPPAALEENLLAHLKGDTVFVVGQLPIRAPGRPPGSTLIRVPTLAAVVETDNRDSVETVLEQIADNLLRLVNLQSGSDTKVQIRRQPLNGGGEVVRSIPLESLFPSGLSRELFGSLELSWAVTDRWLVMATHHEMVRQIIQARQGVIELMPGHALQQAMRRERHRRRLPDTVLVAQPGRAGEMFDSWVAYFAQYHPQMFEPQWWQRLRRTYWASRVQLGILPGNAEQGMVPVARTLANWPAHGRLQVGDRILAVDGRTLDSQDTLRSLRDRLAQRDREDRVILTVLRAGERRDVEIPMETSGFPGDQFQPMSVLEQAAEISRVFAFASYTTWKPEPQRVRTRLDLHFSTKSP